MQNSTGIRNAGSGIVRLIGGVVEGRGYGIYNVRNGKIELYGGTVTSFHYLTNYAIYNQDEGIIAISGGTVDCTKSNGGNGISYGVYNPKGTVIVEGGTITTKNSSGNGINSNNSSYGIYNSSGRVMVSGGKIINNSANYNNINKVCGIENVEGIVTITGGNISGNYSIGNITGNVILIKGVINGNYGVYNSGTGSVILGDKEKEISLEDLVINSKEYGISNVAGNIEFYNGIVQGGIFSNTGGITKIRDGYKVQNEIINEVQSMFLVKKENVENIVEIDDIKYSSLQHAIDTIDNNAKIIKVIKDFELQEIIKFNKNITLDLNGYKLTNRHYLIENTGELKIIDTSENKTGEIKCNETKHVIINRDNGSITIENSVISINSNEQSYGIYNLSTGTVKITGGNINCIGGSEGYGVYNSNIGAIEITEGKITINASYSYGIYNKAEGTAIIIGGEINSSGCTSYGIYNNTTGIIEINEGVITSVKNYAGTGKSYGVYNANTGMVLINDVEIDTSGDNNNSYGIYNEKSGNITINKGIINSNNCGIYNASTGNITVNEGTITGVSYGIYNYKEGTINIARGNVISSANANSYGIYNASTGNVIVGIKGDEEVSTENPYIVGEYTGTLTKCAGYGIYNVKGNLYIYDGIIQGTTKAIYDTITEREDSTELNYNEDETILILSATLTPVAQIGETTYTSLQECINAVPTENKTTIKILRNITFTNNDSVVIIPNNKNIIIDLNGNKIISSILGNVVQNEGNLEITDTSENTEGKITTAEENTINNLKNAILTISNGTIDNRKKQAIYNEGEVIVKGGIVSAVGDSDCYGIYNLGTVTIEDGEVTSKSNKNHYSSYGIYNAGTDIVTVNGGIINSESEGTSLTDNYGIYNSNTGEVIIKKGIISGISENASSSGCGIYNCIGQITVKGGTIRGSNCGIYNDDIGNIIVGDKGDGEILTDNILIISELNRESCAIYNNKGKLCIYDGTVKSFNRAIYGIISALEEMTELQISTDENNYEVITLQEKETNVALVNGTEYDSIQKAVLACETTENTIQILRDSDPNLSINIGENQEITIDLNGFTINNYTEIKNNGILKIIDSSDEQKGKIIGLTGYSISNDGIMEFNGGRILGSGYGINNSGRLTMRGGNINNNIYGIYNFTNGVVNIEGGTISSNTYGVYNYGGTSHIKAGIISTNKYGVLVSGGSINIIGSEVLKNNTYGIYASGGTTTIKEGSEIQSNTGVYVGNGTLNIGETGTMNSSSPVIIGEEYGLVVSSTATVNLYDGQIRGKTGATQGFITNTEIGYAVANKVENGYFVDYLALAGTISTVAQVNGIDFSNLQSAINSIVGEEIQTIKLTNGISTDVTFTINEGQNIILDMNEKTITSSAEVTINNAGNLTIIDSTSISVGKISNTAGTAIVNSGTLTLGQDDGTVSQELITIEGTTYGIENSGTLNFYDGTINGASAVNGTITNRATGYIIRTTTVNGKERYYLSAS